MIAWFKKYNIVARIAAVLIAIALWVLIVDYQNPVMTMEINGVAPLYIGAEELAQKDLHIVSGAVNTVNLKVRATRKALVNLDKSKVTANVDVLGFQAAGTTTLSYKISIPDSTISVVSSTPAFLQVECDLYTSKTVEIRPSKDVAAADGFFVSDVQVSPKTVVISGYKKQVDKVAYAVTTLKKQGIKDNFSDYSAFELYDAQDQKLTWTNLSAEPQNVLSEVTVLPCKTLPVLVNLIADDILNPDNITFEYAPKTIKVAAKKEVLDTMENLVLGTFTSADLDGQMTKTYTPILPEGVFMVSDPPQIQVSYKLTGLRIISLETSQIVFVNASAGLKPLPESQTIDIILRGDDKKLAALTVEQLILRCNLDGINGRNTSEDCPLSITVNSQEDITLVGEYSLLIGWARE